MKYKENNSRTVNCSLRLIQQAVTEKWVKQLGFFHLVKSNYLNSCIYNYYNRMPEIAEKFNISLQSLYSYFKLLKEKKLCCDYNNHLLVKSIRKIKHDLGDKRKTQIHILPSDSLFNIQCRLFGKLIETHLKKAAFSYSMQNFGKVKNQDANKMVCNENGFCPSLSLRNVAKLLNINERTAIRVLNTLNQLDVLITEKQKPYLLAENVTAFNPELVSDYPGYKYILNGRLYVQFGFKYQLIEYPIMPPKITLQTYIKIKKQ